MDLGQAENESWPEEEWSELQEVLAGQGGHHKWANTAGWLVAVLVAATAMAMVYRSRDALKKKLATLGSKITTIQPQPPIRVVRRMVDQEEYTKEGENGQQEEVQPVSDDVGGH